LLQRVTVTLPVDRGPVKALPRCCNFDRRTTMARKRRPSPAFVLAFIALLVALGGTAAAQTGLLTGADVKDNSIASADLRNDRVAGADIKNETIKLRDINPSTVEALAVVNLTKVEDAQSGAAVPVCPAGMQVVSGGGQVVGGASIAASGPNVSNTGWIVTASDGVAPTVAFAYCSPDVTITVAP
jgi:hypothetical protein